MSKSFLLPIVLLASLSILTSALWATQQGSYFYVPQDNHLSYELYQTRTGAIAHSIEPLPLDQDTYASSYALINLDAKDAISILSDLVRSCDLPNPTFQALHYHAQTETLVYYCAKNSSLLILNQQDQTIQSSIPLPTNVSLPVAKLSTDGDQVVAILLMDTLFKELPQNSILYKVNLQTKTLTTQILFNQNLTKGEAVVAYAAGKNHAYIATNRVQGNRLTTVVSSIILTTNTYQLTQIATFNSSVWPSRIITKLLTLGDYVIVNNATGIHFFDQQGSVLETQIYIKSLTSQTDALSVPAVTGQYDGNLYALKNLSYIAAYSIKNGTIQEKKIAPGAVYDFQIAFGKPATQGTDLVFIPNTDSKRFFDIFETNTFKSIYQAAPRYADLVLTDTTYAIVCPTVRLSEYPEIYIFDLKTHALVQIIYLYQESYSNKDQKILSYHASVGSDSCYLFHVDLTSGKSSAKIHFSTKDPICSSLTVYARITENGNPEAIFKSAHQYDIISETHGRITFPTTSDTDSINVNFDGDLSLYYYSANQTTNQITASLYAFNPLTKNFSRISTNTLDNKAVENKGFFTSNQSTTFALSEKSFSVINKLNSVWSQENFPSQYNMLTTFTDSTNTQFTFFAYNNSQLATGLPPILFSSHSLGFVPITGERLSTVNGIATGPNSYALQDNLGSIGVIRFFKTDATIDRELISI